MTFKNIWKQIDISMQLYYVQQQQKKDVEIVLVSYSFI